METEDEGGLCDVVRGIDVGAQLLPGDLAVNGSLNLDDLGSRNALVLPFRNRVPGNPDHIGESLLRSKDFEDPLKGGKRLDRSVLHLSDLIHRRLSDVNRRFIAGVPGTQQNQLMVEIPKPEHYTKFSDWLEAARKARSLTKTQIAEIGNRSPQAATKWFKSGSPHPEVLQAIADWAGVDYQVLRNLAEGRPNAPVKAKRGIKPPAPVVVRISRKAEALSREHAEIIEDLVDTLLSKQSGQKQLDK